MKRPRCGAPQSPCNADSFPPGHRCEMSREWHEPRRTPRFDSGRAGIFGGRSNEDGIFFASLCHLIPPTMTGVPPAASSSTASHPRSSRGSATTHSNTRRTNVIVPSSLAQRASPVTAMNALYQARLIDQQIVRIGCWGRLGRRCRGYESARSQQKACSHLLAPLFRAFLLA
jgi:hypothetical protein